MILQLIRNATLRLTYADETILIDPDLAAAYTRPSFTGRSANPMVELPIPIGTITQSISMILVSHLHRDHFDAVELLPASLPLLCQPGDEERIAAPASTIIATHMEALDHATVSRAALRAAANAAGVDPGQLLIPADGETIIL